MFFIPRYRVEKNYKGIQRALPTIHDLLDEQMEEKRDRLKQIVANFNAKGLLPRFLAGTVDRVHKIMNPREIRAAATLNRTTQFFNNFSPRTVRLWLAAPFESPYSFFNPISWYEEHFQSKTLKNTIQNRFVLASGLILMVGGSLITFILVAFNLAAHTMVPLWIVFSISFISSYAAHMNGHYLFNFVMELTGWLEADADDSETLVSPTSKVRKKKPINSMRRRRMALQSA